MAFYAVFSIGFHVMPSLTAKPRNRDARIRDPRGIAYEAILRFREAQAGNVLKAWNPRWTPFARGFVAHRPGIHCSSV